MKWTKIHNWRVRKSDCILRSPCAILRGRNEMPHMIIDAQALQDCPSSIIHKLNLWSIKSKASNSYGHTCARLPATRRAICAAPRVAYGLRWRRQVQTPRGGRPRHSHEARHRVAKLIHAHRLFVMAFNSLYYFNMTSVLHLPRQFGCAWLTNKAQ